MTKTFNNYNVRPELLCHKNNELFNSITSNLIRNVPKDFFKKYSLKIPLFSTSHTVSFF